MKKLIVLLLLLIPVSLSASTAALEACFHREEAVRQDELDAALNLPDVDQAVSKYLEIIEEIEAKCRKENGYSVEE